MFIRRTALFAVTASVVVSIALVAGDCASLWPTPQPAPFPATGQQDFALLQPPDERVDHLAARIRTKEELLQRLIAGDARLAEVTAAYLQLHTGDANYLPALRKIYSAPTPSAVVAQSLVYLAWCHFSDDPCLRAEVTARLVAEYESAYGPLPEPLLD
jgi:hypothetical protein